MLVGWSQSVTSQGQNLAWRDDLASASAEARESGRLLFIVDVPTTGAPQDQPALLALDRLAFANEDAVALIHGGCVPVLRAVGDSSPNEPGDGAPITWVCTPQSEVMHCLVGVYGPSFLERELRFALQFQQRISEEDDLATRRALAEEFHRARVSEADHRLFRSLLASPPRAFDPVALRSGETRAVCSAAAAVRRQRMIERFQPTGDVAGAALVASLAGHADLLGAYIHLALGELPLIPLPLLQAEAFAVFTQSSPSEFDDLELESSKWILERIGKGKPFLIVIDSEPDENWTSGFPHLNATLQKCWVREVESIELALLLAAPPLSDAEWSVGEQTKYLVLDEAGQPVAALRATRPNRLQRLLERTLAAAPAAEGSSRERNGADTDATNQSVSNVESEGD